MPLDLRKTSAEQVVARTAQALSVTFDPATEVRKRRSVGLRTDRNTWVRIEAKDQTRLNGQAWGVEAAATIHGVAMPSWHQGLSWIDDQFGVMWRADETDYITDQSVKPGGILTTAPALSEQWWETLNASLDALSTHTTARTATPNSEPITQARFTATIHDVFPEVDTTVTEWAPAHADLGWANLTAPACYLLDWEDWGMAPRGFDAATLWSQSFAVSALAEQVQRIRHADFASHAGKLAQLFHCAEIIAAPPGYAGPLLEPAETAAAKLLIDLSR